MKTYCIDIDGTLCHTQDANYAEAIPILGNIEKVNKLYHEGHEIVLFTARGSKTGIDWEQVTLSQLYDWGVKFHNLIFGKPFADFYVDDKAINALDFFNT